MRRRTPILIVPVLLLAACAATGGGSSGGASPGASGSPAAEGSGSGGSDGVEHPTGANEPIFIISSAGGFVPVQFLATQTPAFALFGDGRVVMQGAQTLEYPGPALPPLLERTITEDGIQQILEAIGDTNLFDSDLELRGAQAMVADASDTVFTLNAGGREVTVSVYALGMLTPMDGMPMPEGVTEAEIEAHTALQRLNDQMLMLEEWLPADAFEAEGWQPYAPEAMRLYVRDVTDEPQDLGVPVEKREWLADAAGAAAEFGAEQNFGDGTRCGVVEGDAAAEWLEAMSTATQATFWTEEDRVYSVLPRPLLPHEDAACPELVGA